MSFRIIRHYSDCSSLPQGGVLAFGNFDGVHLGHQHILRTTVSLAKHYGTYASVLTFYPHPRKVLFPQIALPLLSSFRQKMIAFQREAIDIVFLQQFNQMLRRMTAETFIRSVLVDSLHIRHLVIGYDCVFGHDRAGNFALLEALLSPLSIGITQVEPILQGDIVCSSTKIRTFLQAGELRKANQLLGYPFQLRARVQKGKQLGRSLGFPTANLFLKEDCPLRFGVYAVEVRLKDLHYYGIANFGIRPTVTLNQTPLLEVHLFDFQEEIYGQILEVTFLEFLRPEKAFASLEELTEQIRYDTKNAFHFFRQLNPGLV